MEVRDRSLIMTGWGANYRGVIFHGVTLVIFLELLIYNPNLNIYAVCMNAFEFTEDGGKGLSTNYDLGWQIRGGHYFVGYSEGGP